MTASPVLTFASLRREQEYGQLPQRNPQLKRVLDGAADYAFAEWGWILCIGDILRTRAESIETDARSTAPGGLGMGRPAGSISPHCVWAAADIVRIHLVPREHVDALVEWINATWIYRPGDKRHVVADARPHGTGPHIHIQVCSETVLRGRAA